MVIKIKYGTSFIKYPHIDFGVQVSTITILILGCIEVYVDPQKSNAAVPCNSSIVHPKLFDGSGNIIWKPDLGYYGSGSRQFTAKKKRNFCFKNISKVPATEKNLHVKILNRGIIAVLCVRGPGQFSLIREFQILFLSF